MFIRQSTVSKITSIILLIFIGYLFVVNTFNYLTVGSFAGPLIPRNTFEEISRVYLHLAIILALGLIAAFLLHKRGKYIISIAVCIAVFVLVNYFPEWFL